MIISALISIRKRAMFDKIWHANVWLLSICLLFIFCFSLKTTPQTIFANVSTLVPTGKIFNQIERLIDQSKWQQASLLIKQCKEINNSPKELAYLDTCMQWVRANYDIESRYSDGSLHHHVQNVSFIKAKTQLQEVLIMIDQKYHKTINHSIIFTQAMTELLAVTQNKETCRLYDVKRDQLDQLIEQIELLIANVFDYGSFSHQNIINSSLFLSELSEQAGLGKAWPLIELAYAYTNNLDSYTYLMTPIQNKALRERLNGFYVGIGIDIISTEMYPVIFDVIQESPADISGVIPGDLLTHVDGHDLYGISDAIVGEYLKGTSNSSVNLKLKRNDVIVSVNVKHKVIDAPSVRYPQIFKQFGQKFGYIKIASFDYDTAIELKREINILKKAFIEGVIIDLRSNGGGMMNSAIEAVRLFINEGAIVTVQSLTNKREFKASGYSLDTFKIPVAILVDKHTASAAEIFTAALKDHHRAAVFGQKTFGKGVIQTLFDLDDGKTALCITTATYIPPSNVSFNKIGIKPNFIVKEVKLDKNNNVKTIKDLISLHNHVIQEAISYLNLQNKQLAVH